MEAREAELLAVPYFHIVFTLPGRIAEQPNLHSRHRFSCPISRGFLLWRLSGDGPGACPRAHNGAVMRNPSQTQTSSLVLVSEKAASRRPFHIP
jgi:hypothetical protein